MENESRIKTKYTKEVIPEMKKIFGYKNNLAVPKIEKVVVTAGLSAGLKDAKFLDIVEDTLRKITGQKPIRTLAKKSISNFKIREGAPVGSSVTLRGEKMYDFLYKLINFTLPRVRDFRGLNKKSFDGRGNYTIGFKEQLAFPEISGEAADQIHGLEVVINTSATDDKTGLALLEKIGLPFKKDK